MKVERKHIKKVTLLKTLQGSKKYLPGMIFKAEDGFPEDIADEIALNRIGVLNIEYEEPQSDSSPSSLQKDEVEEIKEVSEEIPEVPPDKPKPKPRTKKKVG